MRNDEEFNVDVYDDKMGVFYAVAVQYARTADGEISIEGYELEGEEVSREDLVERFGELRVQRLDELE